MTETNPQKDLKVTRKFSIARLEAIQPALINLFNKRFANVKVSYRLQKLLKKIEEFNKKHFEAIEKIRDPYLEKDDNGKPKSQFNPQIQQHELVFKSEELKQEFIQAMSDLKNEEEEFTFILIPWSAIESLGEKDRFSAIELNSLMEFIEEPTEE